MSKARTLANLISDNAELADGQISVAEVVGAAPLANPTFTGTATGTFSGPLTGAVTGNVTGNLTGNVTGDVAGDIDLSAIAATISDTAVDVFVYDTSKDSDGGAWRKRTQGTSWYNETLNTATRGSRKEFPAVAVIVAETTKVTIYDGDDPDLPMWMVFNRAGDSYFISSSQTVTSIAMQNGLFIFGTSTTGTREINFVSDLADIRRHAATATHKRLTQPIVGRNSNVAIGAILSANYLVSGNVNDIAMTVLPNAPVDPATGLPRVTVAVATEGGVSVIKDDETVVDITITQTRKGTKSINFTSDNSLWFLAQQSSSDVSYTRIISAPIPSNDISATYWQSFPADQLADYSYSYYTAVFPWFGTGTLGNSNAYAAASNRAVGGAIGVTIPNEDISAVSFIASDYNTGYQVGNIKLATLSDTDDTDVTGTELVTNGTFDSDVSGWTGSSASLSVSSGELVVTSSAAYGKAAQSVTTVIGETYTISAFAKAGTVAARVEPYPVTSGSGISVTSTSGESISITFVASSTSTEIQLKAQSSSTGTSYFDNISVRLAEEDRSVNGNGLQVFGTVTKNPVASGADLVGYSGFSGSNYLEQPYNADLNFGNGDFCTMGWVKTTDIYGTFIENRNDSSTSGWSVSTSVSGSTTRFRFYLGTAHADSAELSGLANGSWNHWAVLRRGDVVEYWVNGKLESTNTNATWSSNFASKTEGSMKIGVRRDGSQNLTGSLALIRISATAPSAEQIAKIYEDEKVLFQENAQATLHGTSDAVTALAYDDTTELLHVGTSGGRSVFQGLRRVDNTTDAVGAAISASNGLVAEE